jgi:ABC-type sugar transport system ATPase subunit
VTEALRVERVHKAFGPLEVLRGIDLSVAEHEVVCLIGASGSGKSTLLRCIDLLEPIDAGRVVIGGREVTAGGVDANAVRRSIGIVFQAFNLFPHMTVLDNVTLAPRRALRLPRPAAQEQAIELLRRFGLDPESEQAKRAIALVQDHVVWRGGAPVPTPWDDHRFFEGEVEPCINGNVVATGAYFGVDMTPLVDRLLGEQLPDGGWNCEVENGATASSFGTTINVLEGLLEHERAIGGSTRVWEARRRGEAYLLERRLFRRKSTGEVIDPSWLEFSFPTWYFYDVLRGLDYLRDADREPDERLAEAIEVVERNRDADGRWPLQNVHDGESHFEMEGDEGQPSRWNTLRSMRVLNWHRES